MSEKRLGKNNRVILSVTNDLSTDQRVHKVALSLKKIGFQPLLVGRITEPLVELPKRSYLTKRFKLPFTKGPFFYGFYNCRLFIFLLLSKAKVFIANDLDTLLANYMVYKIKRAFGNKKLKLVYDSHEIYTEVPELNGRTWVKKAWLLIEKNILPKLINAYTVCEPIADYYKQKYSINMQVIRNMPLCSSTKRKDSGLNPKLPSGKKIILYQGALNMGRGIEHIINIMDQIENTIFVIAGKGGIEMELQQLVINKKLTKKVIFIGKLPLEELHFLTQKANLGLVLQEDISLSYRYVLPNRLFDFIKSGIPILASELPEIKRIVKNEHIGLLIRGFDQKTLQQKINRLLNDNELIQKIKQNLINCVSKYCWEKEEQKLFDIYKHLK